MSGETLRERLRRKPILVVPGISDALGALLAEQAGFEAVYLSGASLAYSRLGRPDIGLLGLEEVGQALRPIRERVALPIVVDADTGFGNAINVRRTVRLLEQSGANGIQLEDQVMPKRCGHLAGKALVSTAEMTGKIKAAVDARRDRGTLIIARTDAIAVEGFEAALERAAVFVEAGADLLFVEAPRSDQELAAAARLGERAPLMANMVEGGRTPPKTAVELQDLGYAMVIFPGGLMRAIAHTAEAYFTTLRESGTTAGFRNRMLDFDELNQRLGTPELIELGQRYDEDHD